MKILKIPFLTANERKKNRKKNALLARRKLSIFHMVRLSTKTTLKNSEENTISRVIRLLMSAGKVT